MRVRILLRGRALLDMDLVDVMHVMSYQGAHINPIGATLAPGTELELEAATSSTAIRESYTVPDLEDTWPNSLTVFRSPDGNRTR